ncbi:hypothetical protein JL107_01250 [Nakamurella flavida]|uniref:Uncharacterized protein n=1 Tax=Nakamurella flavida TaxID=363630 RepID=A0A938YI65_9ACTN|nr:hypothetical protein [Nakamurella flavida]MBM9475061.1 hypothetical protein [Nakamurella flavida]MDP9776630.1 hypothetical protein [Nakamurella flavida]
MTAVPTDLAPGTVVTVSGQNFSGCATTDGTAPTPEIPVKVGVLTAEDEMGDLLAETTTAADGSFTVQITIPAVSTAEDQIAIGAQSEDPATGLVYFFALPLSYTGPTATPTAVPAGVGDLAASASDGEKGMLIGLGAAGFLLVAGGATVAVRRREHAQQH